MQDKTLSFKGMFLVSVLNAMLWTIIIGAIIALP
jgi:hypothetical protein